MTTVFGLLRLMPLMALPLAVFMLLATAQQSGNWTDAIAFAPVMMSGVQWHVSYGDVFV